MTLVELLVSVSILSIIMAISIGIFVSQYKTYRSSHSSKTSQSDAQKAFSMIKEDIALAGWGVKPQLAFFFLDGGANQADEIYINDTTLIGIVPDNATRTASNLAKMVDSNCAACRSYTGTDGTGTLDIDGDGESDFASLPVLVWSEAGKTTIRDTNSGGVLTAAVPTGSLVTPSVRYCVDDGVEDHGCHPESSSEQWVLRREGRDTGGARQPMAENVVDLQVSYMDDGNNTYGTTGAPQMNPFDPSTIKWVDLTIITRSTDRVRSTYDTNSCRPSAGNHSGSTALSDCGYEYRAYTTRITPFSSIK